MTIPFNNLQPLHKMLAAELDTAIQRVVQSGWFILGPEVEAFEVDFAAYHNVKYAVGVASGTDAIELALRSAGIGLGDEVITVSHTAAATVCAIERAGAKPLLVDIDPITYTMDPVGAEAAITSRTKALIPVHLYGQPADLTELTKIAERHRLLLIEDCAQAHGARLGGRLVGTFGQLGTFSFYPTKNLGAYGDGGAVITNDAQLAQRLRRLRNYGQSERYYHLERGINSRLDEIQAAVLRTKLKYLDNHNALRQGLAQSYAECLRRNNLILPGIRDNAYHVYHLYVIRHPQREQLMSQLRAHGIGTLIHYPIPNHLQPSYADLGYARGSLPETERAADEILSLPMYIGLTASDVAYVAEGVASSLQEIQP